MEKFRSGALMKNRRPGVRSKIFWKRKEPERADEEAYKESEEEGCP